MLKQQNNISVKILKHTKVKVVNYALFSVR